MPYVMIKPKVLKARQFIPAEKPWPEGIRENLDGDGWYLAMSTHPWCPTISAGDWVIYEEENKFVCLDRDFKEKYEIVHDIDAR